MSVSSAYPQEVAGHGTLTIPAAMSASDATLGSVRLAAWQALSRPRIALMSAIAVSVGFLLASVSGVVWSTLLCAVAGIVCFVASSSILNQVLERSTDALMLRTLRRPLVQGTISVREALILGIGSAVAGLLVLWIFVNPVTAVASLLTMLTYVLVYTPLKCRSTLCTTVGAIPGAMPPVLGWLAAGGQPGIEALALFAIFFVWQFPHFLAIAWIYRDQYRRAGLKMLPRDTDGGRRAGIVALVYAIVFVPVACLPRFIGLAGDGYFAAAVILSVGYLILTVFFSVCRSDVSARRLMTGSLLCLPVLLLSLVIDFLRMTT